MDKAYWDWYTGYCTAETTTVITVTTVYTPTVTPYSPVTTTYEYTSEYGWTAAPSAPASGLPYPPASPVAPYGGSSAGAIPGYSTPAAAAPTGKQSRYAKSYSNHRLLTFLPGYGAPSASAWAPVPATGAGSVTKPGFFLAAAMAVAAFF